jgi:beta-glucosidase
MIAEQGTVLLRNTGRLLPLDSAKTRSIAVVGDAGGPDAMTGGGDSVLVAVPSVVTPYQGIKAYVGNGATVSHAQGIGSPSTVPATFH